MHDIKAIRADPAAFDAGMARRGALSTTLVILRLGNEFSASQTAIDLQRTRQKMFAQAYQKAQSASDALIAGGLFEDSPEYLALITEQSELLGEAGEAKKNELELDAKSKAQRHSLDAMISDIPNLPAPDVPDGLDETANVVVATHGTPPAFDFPPKEHDTLALRFGYDPDAAAAIAGARFAVLRGPLARLHRALGQFMLDANVAAGWTEVAPPLLVREAALFGTGQLPKFEDDLFKTAGDPPRYLIPTSEVSLTNLVAERTLDLGDLPLRYTALTPCFRAEAGSAGRDTRGLIRQHQFDKVELVAIVADAAAAAAEHEAMTRHAEGLLDALGLPYRRMLLCAGDMGFQARKTFDLEVWLPGQNAYREISSVSDCGDFQARRMNHVSPKGGARYKTKGQKGTTLVHTLNGSALAVGRCLVAVLENYQRADGSVAVPEVLLPYMGGVMELVPS